MSAYLRKYATLLAAATAGSTKVRLSIRKADGSAFATGADWTPAAGDVNVSQDGGAEANVGTLPAYSNGQWEFVLSAAELTCKNAHVTVVDAAVELLDFNVETFGHASAMYLSDYTALLAVNVTHVNGEPATPLSGAGFGAGTGDTPVDHDTGGADNLRVLSDGSPVDNATLRAYLRSEYDADRTNAELRGTAYSNVNGEWVEPMMLDEGQEYAILAEKAGVMQAQTIYVTP